MEQHILVPLDGSLLATTAVPHALALARATNSSILLVHVSSPDQRVRYDPNAEPDPCDPVADATGQPHAEAMREHLDRVAAALQRAGVAVGVTLLVGSPGRELVELVNRTAEITTIVMATHGRSGLRRWLWGSVAHQLLSACPVPLMLIRETAPAPAAPLTMAVYHRIMIPLDGSAFAEQSLVLARYLPGAFNATVYLTSVIPAGNEQPMIETGTVLTTLQQNPTEAYTHRYDYLRQIADRFAQEHIDARPDVVHGTPAEGLLRTIRDQQIDLVIMATHERTLVGRILDGNVALQVLHDAHVPIILIRVPESAQQQQGYAGQPPVTLAVDSEFEPHRRRLEVADMSNA
ncbi:MAG: universal stress protein [Herpetosiphon sp.]